MRKISIFSLILFTTILGCSNKSSVTENKNINNVSSSQKIVFSQETQKCIDCHKDKTPALVKQWQSSKHYLNGIGCYECHKAEKQDIDALAHNGFYIRVVISPKVCGKCHVQEAKEFMASKHAHGGKYVYSSKNVLGMLTTGMPNNFAGCARCHGAKVVLDEKGSPIAGPWPNQGIGRFNPDGSIGACS
ncbi:MAG TPA: hydroxylamine oxidoreductase, partial [Aquificae bacterium]|nr:hydroxylamine oxidoreductase [Aquificota bacterium]